MSLRIQKISDLIHRELAHLIQRTIYDRRLTTVNLTRVAVSADLKSAKIFFTTRDHTSQQSATIAFKKATGYLRRQLSSSLNLRHTPVLQFLVDRSLDQSMHLYHIIDDLMPASAAIKIDSEFHQDDS